MIEGKWFLVYQEYNTLAGCYERPEYEERVELKSDTEESATIEAGIIWKARLYLGSTKHNDWSKKEYPHNPRLRYETALPEPNPWMEELIDLVKQLNLDYELNSIVLQGINNMPPEQAKDMVIELREALNNLPKALEELKDAQENSAD